MSHDARCACVPLPSAFPETRLNERPNKVQLGKLQRGHKAAAPANLPSSHPNRRDMRVYAAVLVLSFRLSLGTSSPEGRAVEKRQSRYICGTEPYRFHSDVREFSAVFERASGCLHADLPRSACNAYTLCPNGGVKTFVGCSTNVQCQIHDADTVCIGEWGLFIARALTHLPLRAANIPFRFVLLYVASCSGEHHLSSIVRLR
ncbi:unnamed protein product [Heligmosomoides polygyrus]|uniref:Chitin-binding type-2 domain-containing protein n=1 Tax=Heligmosomoides polygyrus TaxID=6339 RepID=A0A183FJF7_HELPZ|nr:unnamed protein product [Heligmosomoides polygyrus]